MAKLLTKIGKQKLLVSSPLNPLTIKSVAIGSGAGSFNENIDQLQAEEWRGNASDPIKEGTTLGFSSMMPTSVGGFNCCEWGWIDSEGDLIAYGQFENPIYKSVSYTTFEPELYIELSNSTDANLIVSDFLNWEHNKMTKRSAPDAHPISSITGLRDALDAVGGKVHNGLESRDAPDAHPIDSITGLSIALNNLVVADEDIQAEIDLNKNIKTITSSYTLTTDDAGSFLIDASASDLTITMLPASQAKALKYMFLRTDASSHIVTIQCAGSDAFYGEGATRPAGRMQQYEPFTLQKLSNSAWSLVRSSYSQLIELNGKPIFNLRGVNSGELALVSSFESLHGRSGYQKLPSGLIIQWGTPDEQGQSGLIAYPIAFPNKTLYAVISETKTGEDGGIYTFCWIRDTTTATEVGWQSTGNAGNVSYLAIGH